MYNSAFLAVSVVEVLSQTRAYLINKVREHKFTVVCLYIFQKVDNEANHFSESLSQKKSSIFYNTSINYASEWLGFRFKLMLAAFLFKLVLAAFRTVPIKKKNRSLLFLTTTKKVNCGWEGKNQSINIKKLEKGVNTAKEREIIHIYTQIKYIYINVLSFFSLNN